MARQPERHKAVLRSVWRLAGCRSSSAARGASAVASQGFAALARSAHGLSNAWCQLSAIGGDGAGGGKIIPDIAPMGLRVSRPGFCWLRQRSPASACGGRLWVCLLPRRLLLALCASTSAADAHVRSTARARSVALSVARSLGRSDQHCEFSGDPWPRRMSCEL